MKGYVYKLYEGADPSRGWVMNDPIFERIPTLGACVPNIRRSVVPGDWIFCVSGRVDGVQPFVVGGLRVAEKIDALIAYERFPENRLHTSENGQILGNVITDQGGSQHPLDDHSAFERRVENYIVGDQAVYLETDNQFETSRAETLGFLSDLFGKPGNRVFDVIGRHRKMDATQVERMISWLEAIRGESR